MPPPHAPTSFLPGKEEQPQNYREKTSHRPTTWTTPQEVSGWTIELLHREKIVKKKTCAGVSDKTKSCAVFPSIHIVHATPAQHSSCFAPLWLPLLIFLGGDANIYVRSMCSRSAHTCTEQLRSREQQVHFFWKLCTNGLVPDCFLVLGLDNIMSMRSKPFSNAARLGPLPE